MARFVIFSSFLRGSRDGRAVILAIVAYITIPIAAMLVHLAIARGREYKADEIGAKIINDPLALARALDKLENGNLASHVREDSPVLRENPSSAHMWIANPFGGKRGVVSMFSTHPPMQERIARLNKMAGKI
jgi:heat shock protein HtpX